MTSMFDMPTRVVRSATPFTVAGRVAEVAGLSIVVNGLPLSVGDLCRIHRSHAAPIPAQVVAVRRDQAILMPMSEPLGVRVNDRVVSAQTLQVVPVGRSLLGRVVNGMGVPIDDRGAIAVAEHAQVQRDAPAALDRHAIDAPISTGIRSIDAMHTLGCGQRMGVFAGTGVGKSVLMGMIARSTSADVTVVGLIGERGREVGDFIRRDLGEEGMKKCVLVVSTSNESPVMRVRAAFVASAIAEFFRDLGNHVLLMMDSVTRVAMAQRQIGLAAGEPPTSKGYPPSVFGLLPQLLERAGRTEQGSITGLYTVLVEGDDMTEPVSDAVRGTLDGHVWLSRALANRAHYPAVSVLESVSRVMPEVAGAEHLSAARNVRRVLAVWNDIEDLVNVGAYARGTNLEFDIAVEMKPAIDAFLQQSMDETATLADSVARLCALSSRIDELRLRAGGAEVKA